TIAGLPLPNEASGSWPDWYAGQRLLPYLRRGVDAGWLTAADARVIEKVASQVAALAGPPEPPSRIHGDCWSGNVVWSGGRGWLIDPAAQGGHRETALAMLALFGAGAPLRPRFLGPGGGAPRRAAAGPRGPPRPPLPPRLVHACLFGRSYR